MRKARPAALLLAGVLLSCSTPKVDPLEAKAQSGDPVAACQLAARDIRACALEKQADNLVVMNERLACYDTMLDDRKMGYLDKAISTMNEKPGAEGVLYMRTVMRLKLVAGRLPILKVDDARKYTAELEQECADLSKYAA